MFPQSCIMNRYLLISSVFYCLLFLSCGQNQSAIANAERESADLQKKITEPDSIGPHKVVLDENEKLLSWMAQDGSAFDQFLRQRWNFIKTKVPNSPGPPPRSQYPQYYFYCAFKDNMEPDTWMNDVGEKIPNWFESARLYYAYTGDSSVMEIVKGLIDYSLKHGISPADFSWPDFPYTTTNAGDTIFQGFTSAKRFVLHEIQVDHAGEIGLTYYRMYKYYGEKKYLDAAVKVANTLAAKVRNGNAEQSPWPYRVEMKSGTAKAEYGANWTGCYMLLDRLAKDKAGDIIAYISACKKIQDFLLNYPLKTGYWTDGHSDTDVNSNTYKSNLSASNFTLFLFDHPLFDSNWKKSVPDLIRWTEDNFINRSAPGEASSQWGANIVGEQDSFMYKMDYQTARYAAACARWYAASGDTAYKEKAYRSLNWVTYCNDSTGKAYESPLSKNVLSWWSDTYGECPRMFYHAFAAIPEWAPPGKDHILYSEGILRKVRYEKNKIAYNATENSGVEFVRTSFRPNDVRLNGVSLPVAEKGNEGYTLKNWGNGDYSIVINRIKAGEVIIQ